MEHSLADPTSERTGWRRRYRFSHQPIVGAGKATNYSVAPRRQCAKTGRVLRRFGQDQMDLTCNIAHPFLLSLSRARRQHRWLGDGAVPDGFDIHWCAGRDCAAGLRR
jgi:hypothetical protein